MLAGVSHGIPAWTGCRWQHARCTHSLHAPRMHAWGSALMHGCSQQQVASTSSRRTPLTITCAAVQVGQVQFPTKQECRAYFQEILNRPERVLPRMLTEREQRDVLELLKYHQRASEKIGPGVEHIEVDFAPETPGALSTICFWIVRTDGSRTDFSYVKCVERAYSMQNPRKPRDAARSQSTPWQPPGYSTGPAISSSTDNGQTQFDLYTLGSEPWAPDVQASSTGLSTDEGGLTSGEWSTGLQSAGPLEPGGAPMSEVDRKAWKQDLVRLFRRLVQPQVDEFRREEFERARSNGGVITCAMTGAVLTPATCHVDHQAPATFKQLMKDFIASLPPADRLQMLRLENKDGSAPFLADPAVAEAWQAYHAQHARLRLLSPKANMAWRRHTA